jgi:peptidoglycan/xylan/chitin deacetylase (PgdA/CDA1 family)
MTSTETIKKTLKFLGRIYPRDVGRRVVVLCYHSVHPSMPFRSATPELFSDHLSWIVEHCRCVPFQELPNRNDQPSDGRPVVSLTFDDGYADNHEFVLPRLAAAGLSATFFLTAGFVELDPSVLDRLSHLQRVDPGVIKPLGWEQIREMIDAGMEIGAHGYSHANLANLPDTQLKHELTHSKRVIEDRLGQSIRMMAYPFGRPRVHFTKQVTQAAQGAGYELAASAVTRGVKVKDDPLSLPRIFATRDSVDILREKIVGVWDLIGTIREKAPLTVSRFLSPADFSVP